MREIVKQLNDFINRLVRLEGKESALEVRTSHLEKRMAAQDDIITQLQGDVTNLKTGEAAVKAAIVKLTADLAAAIANSANVLTQAEIASFTQIHTDLAALGTSLVADAGTGSTTV